MKFNANKKRLIKFYAHPMMGVNIVNWFRLLTINRFRIHTIYLPQVVFITLTALVSTPLQLVEYILFNRGITRQKVERPVFILGHPRSGTTHLFYLLSKDDQFAYCKVYNALLPHIFLTGGKTIRALISKAVPKTRPQDNVKINIDSPKEEEFGMANIGSYSYLFNFYFPKNAKQSFAQGVTFSAGKKYATRWQSDFKRYVKKLAYANAGKRLLLKSPANTARVNEILECFPDAFFIHIHRDPSEVYVSTRRLYEKVIKETGFQTVDAHDINEQILTDYVSMHEKLFEATSGLRQDQLVTLSYADLVNAPLDSLATIYGQLEPNRFDQIRAKFIDELNETTDYEKNTYSALSAEETTLLRSRWGAIANRLGYWND